MTRNPLMHRKGWLLPRDLKCENVAIGWLGVGIHPCVTWGRITYLFRLEIFGMANLLKRESLWLRPKSAFRFVFTERIFFVYFGGKCLVAGPRHLCDQVFEKRHKDTIGCYTRNLVA